MKVLAIIPARYNSTRFPGKPLVEIHGKTMIERVYQRVIRSNKILRTIVATDDIRIEEECKRKGLDYMMTSSMHTNGTERCAEVVSMLNEKYDLIINVQGDEPFIDPKVLEDIITIFETNPRAEIGTLIEPLKIEEELLSPNIIKVVFDRTMKALYFSRFAIPFQRNNPQESWFKNYDYWKHIGLYAFKPDVLKEIVDLKPSSLEVLESLEQLRWLENGYTIHINKTESNSKSIDTPEDLQYILQHYNTFSND